MPRNRTVRLAVLGSSVQRAAAEYPSRAASPSGGGWWWGPRRPLAALITVYFRESSTGGLHDLQGAAATVLRPFQVASRASLEPVP